MQQQQQQDVEQQLPCMLLPCAPGMQLGLAELWRSGLLCDMAVATPDDDGCEGEECPRGADGATASNPETLGGAVAPATSAGALALAGVASQESADGTCVLAQQERSAADPPDQLLLAHKACLAAGSG
jgi:hypothetical protein